MAWTRLLEKCVRKLTAFSSPGRRHAQPLPCCIEQLEDRCLLSTLTINASQQLQTIAGFGTNLSSEAWNGGALAPSLDTLISHGFTLFRVIVEPAQGWEDSNPNTGQYSDSNPNWAYYDNLYGTSTKFTDLWNTISYLNSKGATVWLNLQSDAPAWMTDSGGAVGSMGQDHEADWATMVSTLMDYAVNVAHVHIDALGPMNEPDNTPDPVQGPQVGATQYVRMMDTLETQLQGYGLGYISLVGPDDAQTSNAVNSYIPAMLADSFLMPHVLQFGFHNYGGSTSSDPAVTSNSTYPGRQIISDEYDGDYFDEYDGQRATPAELWTQADTSFQNVMAIIGAGENGAVIWDGVDNYYEYYGEWSDQGLISYNWNAANPTAQSDYGTTPRLYANAQMFQFVPAGSVLVGSSTTASNFIELAFRNPDGQITLVGENTGTSTQSITGSITGGPNATQFNMYFTNSTLDEQQQANVAISNKSFSFSVPADTIFTLTSVPTAPLITGVSPGNGLTTGGQAVILSGSDFTNATKVSFGGVPASSFTVNSDQQITAISPAGAAGTVDLSVTIASGTSAASAADQFKYVAPEGTAGPTLASGASATLSGNQTFALLSVQGASQYDADTLTYLWSTLGTPPAPVTFTANDNNSASNITALFYAPGNYDLQVTVTDPAGNSVESEIVLAVNQVATTFTIAPTTATVAPDGAAQFSATVLDQFGDSDLIAPDAWSVSGGGTIDGTGKFTAGSSTGGPFTVSASIGGLSTTCPITIFSGVNVAPAGTAYRWSGLNNATSNNNRTAAPGLNDNNLTADVTLTGGGVDAANAYEAAGVVWSGTQSIFEVTFTNGSFGGSNNGVFDNNLGLQITTNGTTWTAASGWSLTPAYPYNNASAADRTYVFTGPAVSVLGFRVVGEVHSLSGTDSQDDNATEVQAFNSSIPLPSVTGIGPATGGIAGGTVVTITGANFAGAVTVSFGGLPASAFTVNSATQITAVAPAASVAGAADVRVTTADGISAIAGADQFNYVSSLVGEYLFYKDSVFDTGSDDAAIAPDKTALLPGETASFANYSSYSDGINGIMVDLAGAAEPIAASDFQINVGNDSDPADWPAGPAPTVTTRPGAGVGGSTRVELTWPDDAIANEWLQITVLAGPDTGLASNAVFYFGNAIGESGDSTDDAQVTPADELGAQENPANLLTSPASITDPYDYNRDGRVDATDQLIARVNTTNSSTALQLIDLQSVGDSLDNSGNSGGPADSADAAPIAPAIAGASGYNPGRGTASGAQASFGGLSLNTLSYVDSTDGTGMTYYYRAAANAGGQSSPYRQASFAAANSIAAASGRDADGGGQGGNTLATIAGSSLTDVTEVLCGGMPGSGWTANSVTPINETTSGNPIGKATIGG